MAVTPNLGLTKLEVGQSQKEPTINTNYDILDASVSGGSSFPSTPATNRRFFRNDRGIEYFYNGTRWLSTKLFLDTCLPVLGAQPYAVTSQSAERLSAPYAGTFDLWLIEAQFLFFILNGTALSGAHKWVSVLSKQVAAGTQTTLATVTIDSGAINSWRTSVQAINALLGVTNLTFEITHTKTGTPGNLYTLSRIVYRLVG